ncbi:MAG TPA: tail fiber domain-containing protein, partial [Thermoanaerobaculia bacterium]|nr:tail fiber domain-containing protein [Thermoanaerobaculia bacterium]
CGIPVGAQALSLNATVVKPTGSGFLVLYPQGGTFPPVSTLNFLGNDVIVNAAVVPISVSGGISMALGVSGGDVILDVNGYYAPTPSVTSLNSLTGDVTLAAGTNVTITPTGNTLTIASTGGSGGPPTGAAGGSLSGTYPNPGIAAGAVGSAQIATGAVTDVKVASGISYSKLTGVPGFVLRSGDTMTGSLTLSGGNLVLGVEPSSGAGGSIVKGGQPFLHDTGQINTFLGLESGNGIAAGGSGIGNTGVGWGAFHDGSSGGGNTAIGNSALFHNTKGDSNAAVGAGALSNNTTGGLNTAMGSFALQANTAGSRNTALGYGAGSLLTTGDYNIDLYHPGVDGDYGVIRIGLAGYQTRAFLAGIRGVTTGATDALPVFVDSNGQLGTAGGTINATNFSGSLAGDVTGTQSATVVAQVGGQAAANVAAGAVAANAAASTNTASTIVKRDASGNFAAGTITAALSGAASANVLKSGDTMTGTLTLDPGNISFSAATSTAATGSILKNGTRFLHNYGTQNTFLGVGAGNFSMSLNPGEAFRNTGVGALALSGNATGSLNTAVGYFALLANTSGSYNTAVGGGSLVNSRTGSRNTAVGGGTLSSSNGDDNTALGHDALYYALDAGRNTAVGSAALRTTMGAQNTALGYQAGARAGAGTGYGGGAITFLENTTGNYNTFLGYGTGATASVSNCTAVGIDAYCDAGDQVRLGNFFVNSIGGKVGWSALSDARAKEDIRDLDAGLDLVLRLRPVSYRLKGGNGRTDLGFLAQDVEALLGNDFGVVTAGGDPDRTLSLRYQDFIAPLVKAVQQQQREIDEAKKESAALRAALEELKGELVGLRNSMREAR